MACMMRQTAPFADDTKLGGVGETSDECAAFQRDSDSLQKWVNRILIKFKKRKCQVLHLGRKSEVPEDGLKHYVWAPFFFSWGPSSRNVLLPALVSCSTWSTSSVKAGAVWTTGDCWSYSPVCDSGYLAMEGLFNFWHLEDQAVDSFVLNIADRKLWL